MKLGQENTDISITVDVINDLNISAQVHMQQSTLKSYIICQRFSLLELTFCSYTGKFCHSFVEV